MIILCVRAIGDGSYAFIPDANFVGTVFVHSVANALTTWVRCLSSVSVTVSVGGCSAWFLGMLVLIAYACVCVRVCSCV